MSNYNVHFRPDSGGPQQKIDGIPAFSPVDAAKVFMAAQMSDDWHLNETPMVLDDYPPGVTLFRAGNPHGVRANVRVTDTSIKPTVAPAAPATPATPVYNIPAGYRLPTTDELKFYRGIADQLLREMKRALADPPDLDKHAKAEKVLQFFKIQYGFVWQKSDERLIVREEGAPGSPPAPTSTPATRPEADHW